MRSLTCIICPMGCALSIEEGPPGADGSAAMTIKGNNCSRGAVYAQEEIRAPKRVVTATCAIADPAASSWAPRRVPVKTLLPCPKERIKELLGDIYGLQLRLPIKAGDPVIIDWQGTGITVVAVRAMH